MIARALGAVLVGMLRALTIVAAAILPAAGQTTPPGGANQFGYNNGTPQWAAGTFGAGLTFSGGTLYVNGVPYSSLPPVVSGLNNRDGSIIISGALAPPAGLPGAVSALPQTGALQLQFNANKAYNWGAGQRLGTPAQINLANATAGSLPLTALATTPALYTNTAGGALDNFYACLRGSTALVCDVYVLGDSIITCYQVGPCTYGPYNAINSPVLALRNELLKQFPQYSTGFRPPFRLMPTATVDPGEGGYVLSSGTVTNTPSVTFGPGQTGYSLNGQADLQCTAACVLTINVGQGYRAVNIACVTAPANTAGWTVAIGGTTVGTACAGTSPTTQGSYQTFSNAGVTTATASAWSASGNTLTITTLATGAFAQGGVLSGTGVPPGTTILYQMTGTTGGAGTYQMSSSFTGSSGTLTQTGGLVNSTLVLTGATNAILGGYEAITSVGNVGVAVHNMGEGAISEAFWTQNSTALGWVALIAGQAGHRAGLVILEGGQNDAQNPGVVTPVQVLAQFQQVATYFQGLGASVSLWVPTPFNSPTANQYAWIQQTLWNYAPNPASGTPWDVLLLSDAWAGAGIGGASGTGGVPNFQAQDAAAAIAQSVSAGLLQAQDSQHPSDWGSCLLTKMALTHLLGRTGFNCNNNQLTATPVNKVKLTAAYTNATTGFTTICEASCVHSMIFPVVAFQVVNIRCHLVFQVSAAATLAMTIAGSAGTAASLTQSLDNYTTATTVSDQVSLAQTAYGTAVTSASVTATATNLTADYTATVTHVGTVNAAANLSVQAHPSAGTLTIQADSYCIAE